MHPAQCGWDIEEALLVCIKRLNLRHPIWIYQLISKVIGCELITHPGSREAFLASGWGTLVLSGPHGLSPWVKMMVPNENFHWRCSGLAIISLKENNSALPWNQISNWDNNIFIGSWRRYFSSLIVMNILDILNAVSLRRKKKSLTNNVYLQESIFFFLFWFL